MPATAGQAIGLFATFAIKIDRILQLVLIILITLDIECDLGGCFLCLQLQLAALALFFLADDLEEIRVAVQASEAFNFTHFDNYIRAYIQNTFIFMM